MIDQTDFYALEHKLSKIFSDHDSEVRQVLTLSEEAGEFVGAYRRWKGMARRSGTREEMEAELADVAITALMTACTLKIDLSKAVYAKLEHIKERGYRDATGE